MRVLAIDPAFSNTGWVIADVDIHNATVARIVDGGLISTEAAKTKGTRRSSDDFRRASEIAAALRARASSVQMTFAEIPCGSQNARASWALGIALGTLTNVLPTAMVEVTPIQTKLASIGRKDATKEEIIVWAHGLYPDLPWYKARGKDSLSPRNEHMADAVGVLHAGLQHEDFRRYAGFAKTFWEKVSNP